MTAQTPRTAAANRRGFSLLEVIVVLAILGTIAGVTAPALIMDTKKDDLAQSSDEITTLLDRTRRTAATHGSRATLTIEPGSSQYWVTLRVPEGERTVASGKLALVAGTELLSRDPRPSFTFDPAGRAFASDVSVALNGATTAIIVDAWTGDVRATAR